MMKQLITLCESGLKIFGLASLFLVLTFSFVGSPTALAADGDLKDLDLTGFECIFPGQPGCSGNDLFTGIFGFLRGVASPLAILVVMWGGYQYFFSGISESQANGLKAIQAGIFGFILVQIAPAVPDLIRNTFSSDGTINTEAIVNIINGVIQALLTLARFVAVLVIVIGGYKYFQGGIDDQTDGIKTIRNGVIGLVVVTTASLIVGIFDNLDGNNLAQVPGQLVQQIIPVVQATYTALITLSLAISAFVIVWGGYQYFRGGIDGTSDGLKNIRNGVIGLIIVTVANFMVNTIYTTLNNSFNTGEGGDPSQVFNQMINQIQTVLVSFATNATNALVVLATAVCAFVIAWGGYQYFYGGIDGSKEGRDNIQKGITGLIVVLLAFFIANTVQSLFANIENTDQVAEIPGRAGQILMPIIVNGTNFLITIASVIAVLVIVWGGYKYFASALPEQQADGKDAILKGVIGLIVIIAARPIVTIVEGTIGVQNNNLSLRPDNIIYIVQLLLSNLLIPLSSVITLFFLVLGAYYWVTSNGDSSKVEKAQTAIRDAIIGLIVILLCTTIVQLIVYFVGNTGINEPVPVSPDDNPNFDNQQTPLDSNTSQIIDRPSL